MMTVQFVDPQGVQERQRWMAILAKAPVDSLKKAWNDFPEAQKPETSFLRAPEFGLTMVRGRAGSGGEPFNMGEMTVTRCTVRTADGVTGTAYIQGRDKERVIIAATLDAMMQSPQSRGDVARDVIEPLGDLIEELAQTEARKTAATKVDFFTMVRSREGK